MAKRLREGFVATLPGDQHHLLFLITDLKTIPKTVNKLNIFHFLPPKILFYKMDVLTFGGRNRLFTCISRNGYSIAPDFLPRFPTGN